ncbi:MAG: hypothetical protein JRJ73_15325 [Deltaproteobacteria bacterium]|nr:hypothetical protein [Deltaproteobacteria bacterium]
MKTITVQIEDLEYEILESWLGVGQVKAWLQHAIDNKCRQRTDASVLEHTDRNPKKLNKQTKLDLLKDVQLPTRAERDTQQA